MLIPSLYATSLRTRSLRSIRVPSDQNTRWRLPVHILLIRDKNSLSIHICQIDHYHFSLRVGDRRDAAHMRHLQSSSGFTCLLARTLLPTVKHCWVSTTPMQSLTKKHSRERPPRCMTVGFGYIAISTIFGYRCAARPKGMAPRVHACWV